MLQLLKQVCICTLILVLNASQIAAFDLQVGGMNFTPSAASHSEPYPDRGNAFGATLTIPLGPAAPGHRADTLNGQALSNFTTQDAKDSLIVIMLFGVAIAAGALTVSVTSD